MAVEVRSEIEAENAPRTVEVPAPTAWPLVCAFGVSLVFAGLATSAAISLFGALAAVVGVAGWFRAVLPVQAHEAVAAQPPPPPAVTLRREVVHLQVVRGSRRAWLPVEIYPVKAGIRGGIAGGVAMAVIASLYGIVSGHGIWYPINLLAAGFLPSTVGQTTAEIGRFQAGPFAFACLIHGMGSLLVGVLYGALLPIFPRRPILLAGFAVPLFWVALFHSFIGLINPVLNARIDWVWFIVSQFGFGMVAGFVVSRQERIRTWQGAPFAVRAGVEASGLAEETEEEKRR
jgi:hypothetical protein